VLYIKVWGGPAGGDGEYSAASTQGMSGGGFNCPTKRGRRLVKPMKL